MRKRGRKWLSRRAASAGGAAVVGALALGLVIPPRAGATAERESQSGEPVRQMSGPAGTLRADLVIRQKQVRTDGQLSRTASPAIALRVDRQLAQGRWRTSFTFQSVEAPIVTSGNALVALDNPFMVARLEYDDESGEARAYDKSGRRMPLPTDQDRRAFGVTAAQRGPGWDPALFKPAASPERTRVMAAATAMGGFYVQAQQREGRLLDLERSFGKAVGRVRGLDRFVRTERGVMSEVLISSSTALPAEINIARGGSLTSHAELRYSAAGSAGYVRESLRHERAAGPSAPSDLLVTDVVLTNIEVATGGVE
jgi:hypothetical protein